MIIHDSHIHFLSPGFFATLAQQRGPAAAEPASAEHGGPGLQSRPTSIAASIGWDDPVSPAALADRWVDELDRHGVTRAALMATLPGDALSVAQALDRHPDRFVGYFMLDPTQQAAAAYATSALGAGLRTVCLFPAMHRYSLTDPRVDAIFDLVASHEGPGTEPTSNASPRSAGAPCVFVHCGVLSVGVRKKLGLPSPFEMRFGNPLDLHALALKFPAVSIIIPHFGAGMLREALMLADLCPNVHFDTSSSNGWIKYTPGLTLEAVFKTALDVVGADRLLFGTDSSFFPRGWNREVYERQKAALDAIGASADAQGKIFGGNFSRLFP